MGTIDNDAQNPPEETDRETDLYNELVKFIAPHFRAFCVETAAKGLSPEELDEMLEEIADEDSWTDAQKEEKRRELEAAFADPATFASKVTDEMIESDVALLVDAWIVTLECAAQEAEGDVAALRSDAFGDAMVPDDRMDLFTGFVDSLTNLTGDEGREVLERAKRSLPAGKAAPDALVEYLKLSSGVTVI